jgi:hypothetical protein
LQKNYRQASNYYPTSLKMVLKFPVDTFELNDDSYEEITAHYIVSRLYQCHFRLQEFQLYDDNIKAMLKSEELQFVGIALEQTIAREMLDERLYVPHAPEVDAYLSKWKRLRKAARKVVELSKYPNRDFDLEESLLVECLACTRRSEETPGLGAMMPKLS